MIKKVTIMFQISPFLFIKILTLLLKYDIVENLLKCYQNLHCIFYHDRVILSSKFIYQPILLNKKINEDYEDT